MEAGFHEVVVSPATSAIIAKRAAEGKSLWRVSSTLFSHMQSDQILQPLGQYATAESIAKYPPKMAGQQVTLHHNSHY